MTVTRISSSRVSSKAAYQKMILASGWAACSPGWQRYPLRPDRCPWSGGEVDQHALGAVDGSLQQGAGDGHLGGVLGLVLAAGAADTHVGHASVLHDGRTSAKSRLMRPVFLIRSEMDACRLAEHIIGDLESAAKSCYRLIGSKFQPLIGNGMTRESTRFRSSSMPFSRLLIRRRPSKLKGLDDHTNGQDAHFLGDIGHDGAAAPVPVPPPIPAVINTMSASSRALAISARLSSGGVAAPLRGRCPRPVPPVSFSPI